MKKIFPSLFLVALLGLSCQTQQINAPAINTHVESNTNAQSDLMMGFAKKTYSNSELGFAFDYPEKAIIRPGCPPLPLKVVYGKEIVSLTYEVSANNTGDCAVDPNYTGMIFSARKVNGEKEMEAFYNFFANDNDCKGIEMDQQGASDMFTIFVKNQDITNTNGCSLGNYNAVWNQKTKVMIIYPGKSSGPWLVGDPTEGDFEITGSLRFL